MSRFHRDSRTNLTRQAEAALVDLVIYNITRVSNHYQMAQFHYNFGEIFLIEVYNCNKKLEHNFIFATLGRISDLQQGLGTLTRWCVWLKEEGLMEFCGRPRIRSPTLAQLSWSMELGWSEPWSSTTSCHNKHQLQRHQGESPNEHACMH